MFLRLSFLLLALLSFQSLADIEVPDSVREQIVADVMTESGYFDAAGIEAKIKRWIAEQPQPDSSGEITASGGCSGSCIESGGDDSLPEPRNVEFIGKKTNGKLSKHLVIKWKRPKALPENSEIFLKRYKIKVSIDGKTYKKYKVETKYKENGKPKKHQKLKLRNLKKGSYSVQVRAIYKPIEETTSVNTKSTVTQSTNNLSTNSEWTGSINDGVESNSVLVSNIQGQGQDKSDKLYNCLIDNGYDDSTDVENVTVLVCKSKSFENSDVAPLHLFTGLTLLNLMDNSALTDISFIDNGNLSHLYWINLKGNSLIDFSQPGNSLESLIGLEFANLKVTGLTEIPELPDNISFLNVSQNSISNHYGNFPEDNSIDTLVINNNKVYGVFSLSDAFFSSLSTDNKYIKSIQAKNTVVTDIGILSGIAGLTDLEITSDVLNATQDVSYFSGFCTLNIKSSSLENIVPARPVQRLLLSQNPSLKNLDILTGNLYESQANTKSSQTSNENIFSPIHLDLNNDNNLTCSSYYDVTDFDKPEYMNVDWQIPPFYFPFPSTDPAYPPSCPNYDMPTTKDLPSQCKPNEVASFVVHENINSLSKLLNWNKQPEFDYARWGVTHHRITSYLNDEIIEVSDIPYTEENFLALETDSATSYKIEVCLADVCGYEVMSGGFVEGGLGAVVPMNELWTLGTTDNQFELRFTYSDDDFISAYGKPDYFEIIPQVNGEPSTNQSFEINVAQNAQNQEIWSTPALSRTQYPENSFAVRACRDDIGCGIEQTITVEDTVSSFEVFEDIDLNNNINRRYITWDPSGLNAITYFVISTYHGDDITETYTVNSDQSSHVVIDDNGPIKYSIRSCNADGCSGLIEDSSFEQGLTRPLNLKKNWVNSNTQFEITFDYPDSIYEIAGGKPDTFEVYSNFPQSDGTFHVATVLESSGSIQGGWTTPPLTRNQINGSSFRVEACNQKLGCSYFSSIVVTEPVIDSTNIPLPTLSSAIHNQEGSSITLNWEFSEFDDLSLVDYIKIKETQPRISQNANVGTASGTSINEIITHQIDSPLVLERFAEGTYKYEIVSACKSVKGQGDLDICTLNNTEPEVEVDISTEFTTADLGEVDISNVIFYTVSGKKHMKWQLINEAPDVKIDYFYLYSNQYTDPLNPSIYGEQPVCKIKNRWWDDSEVPSDGKIISLNTSNQESGGWFSTESVCEELASNRPVNANSPNLGKWSVRTCVNGVGCGSSKLIQDIPYDEITVNVSAPESPSYSQNSGPSLFGPGHYWNSDLDGNGWNFFWVNGLNQTAQDGRYGRTYDLVGYWFTYRRVGDVWTPTWFEARLKESHKTDNENNVYYSGTIYSHKKGTENCAINEDSCINEREVGHLDLLITPSTQNIDNSSKATMILNLDYESGLFTPIASNENSFPYVNTDDDNLLLEIENFEIKNFNSSLFTPNNDADHYSGLWQEPGSLNDVEAPLSSSNVSMLTWINGGLENTTVAYFDAEGNPMWGTTLTMPGDESAVFPGAGYFNNYQYDPDISPSRKTIYVVPNAYNPLAQKPAGWNLDSNLETVGWIGRRFERAGKENQYTDAGLSLRIVDFINNGQRDITQFYGNFDNVSGEVYPKINVQGGMVDLVKRANLHGIFYDIAAIDDINAETCDPDNIGPCDVYFSWYTDDQFTTIQPFYKESSDPNSNYYPLSNMCNTSAISGFYPEVIGFECRIVEPGKYTFFLRKEMYDVPNQWVTIAESKELEILGCSSPRGCEFPAIPIPQVVVSDPDIVGEYDSSALITHQPGSGPIPGSGGVSGGAATYSIPITVPPGRNGMTPDLSINYSSKGGNGVMGVGWSVPAGSSIYRCPATMAQDGYSRGVTFDNDPQTGDKLCLDGQKLKAVVGNYWAHSSEYRTEIDSFAKVVYAANKFTVFTKSGRINYYEQLGAQQSSWSLIREEDTYGNSIIYTYNETDGSNDPFGENEILLTEIAYTGENVVKGNRTITFNYADGINVNHNHYKVSFLHGEKTESTKVLMSVDTNFDNALIRKYEFGYKISEANNNILLSTASETVNGIPRELITTQWSDALWNVDTKDSYSYSDLTSTLDDPATSGDFVRRTEIKSDYNGDGIKEVMTTGKTRRSTNDGDLQNSTLSFMNQDGQIIKVIDFNSSGFGDVPVAGSADLNVDGYTDLIVSKVNNTCPNQAHSSLLTVLSWKNEMVISSNEPTIDGSVSQYFDELPICGLDWSYTHHDGSPVQVDLDKSQFYLYDYTGDGKQDIIMFRVAHENNYDRQTPVCGAYDPIGSIGCDIYKNHLVGFENISAYVPSPDPISNPEDGRVVINFAQAPHVFTDLEPNVNRGGSGLVNEEAAVHYYDIVDFNDDLNGNGTPDPIIRARETTKVEGITYSYIQNIRIGFISEDLDSNNHDNNMSKVDLLNLGLSGLTCHYLNDPDTAVSCNESGTDDPVFDSISYTFTDINSDGLKDFVYFDKWIQGAPKTVDDITTYPRYYDIVRTWKARLNQGGPAGNTLFSADVISAPDYPGGVDFLPDGNECENPTTASSLRLCNPLFRSAIQFVDMNNDGDSELLYPEFDMSEKYQLSIDGNNVQFPINLPFNHCGTYNISFANGAPVTPFSNGIAMDILSHASMDVNLAPNTYTVGLNEQGGNSFNGAQTPVTACSYNHTDVVTPIIGDGNTKVYDMYAGGPDFDFAKFDMGVYRFNSIEFKVDQLDGQPLANSLSLDISDETGIYKRLHSGSIGDLNGDGLAETFGTMGCTPGSDGNEDTQCTQEAVQDFALYKGAFTSGNWTWKDPNDPNVVGEFSEADFFSPYGITITSLRELSAPDMLDAVTKPVTNETVEWDHFPISYKFDDTRFAPLYALPERGSADNGYINDVGAIGTHFFFNSSMFVVSEMRQSNGLFDVSDVSFLNENYSTTQYAYEEAVYNNQGRGFQGFRQITVENTPDSNTPFNKTRAVSEFNQVFPIAGRLDSIKNYLWLENDFDLSSEVTYEYKDNLSIHDSYSVYFNPMDSSIENQYELGEVVPKSELVQNYLSYDSYGNVTNSNQSLTDRIKTGNVQDVQEVLTSNSTVNTYYQAVDTDTTWWVDKLNTTIVESSIIENRTTNNGLGEAPGYIPSEVNKKVVSKFFWINDNKRKLSCQYTIGEDEAIPNTCTSGITSENINRNSFLYDDFGNIRQITSSGKTPVIGGGSEIQHRITDTDYIVYQGYFPNKITQVGNAVVPDLATTFSYDETNGNLVLSIDANNISNLSFFDEYGFKTSQGISGLEPSTFTSMVNCGSSTIDCTSAQSIVKNALNAISNKVGSQLSLEDYDVEANTGFFLRADRFIPKIYFVSQTQKSGSPISTNWHDINGQIVLSRTIHTGGESYVMSLQNPLGQAEITTSPFVPGQIPHFTIDSFDEQGQLFTRLVRIGDMNGDGDNCWRKTMYLSDKGHTMIDAKYLGSDCTTTEVGTDNLFMSRTYDSQGKLRQTTDAKYGHQTKYWYDAAGNPHVITDAQNNSIVTVFDDLGRKLSVTDPNMGEKSFTYNSFGEVVFEQDDEQAGDIGNYSFYDVLGRHVVKYWNVTETQDPLTDRLSYHDSYSYTGNCGSVSAICDSFRYSNFNGSGAYINEFYTAQHKSYTYDEFSRLEREEIVLTDVLGDLTNLAYGDGEFSTDYYYYDHYNFLKQTVYNRKDVQDFSDSFYSVVNHYDVYGTLRAQYEGPTDLDQDPKKLMSSDDFNFRGQPLSRTLHGDSFTNVTSFNAYYPNGQIKSITHSGGTSQQFEYEYDAWGNISSQRLNGGITEVFKYDELQRITSSSVENNTISYDYDSTGLGNLISKSDYSSSQVYGENGAGPNAITSAVLTDGVLAYQYDPKGNRVKDILTDNGSVSTVQAQYKYDANNLLIQSDRDDDSSIYFRYGVDQQRYLKYEDSLELEQDLNESLRTQEVTVYAGPHFEEVVNLQYLNKEIKVQVSDYLSITLKANNRIDKHFLQKDRLGSTTKILDHDFNLVKTMSYDVFGKPRDGDTWLILEDPELDFHKNQSLSEIDITKRGFTDHEHLDNFELIHMNGRMYDFNNGRFLSVDPFIQGTTSQAINPYSYIQNNPLSGVDPTGYLVIWDRDTDCAKLSESSCNASLGRLIGKEFSQENGKDTNGKETKFTSVTVSASDIDVDESCKTNDCGIFKMAKEAGGLITIVITSDGKVAAIDFQRKPSALRAVGSAFKEFVVDNYPGMASAKCTTQDCSTIENITNGADFVPFGGVVTKMGGIIFLPIIKKFDDVPSAPFVPRDPTTGEEIGRLVGDSNGNIMIEPVGGSTVGAGRTLPGGIRQDTHTTYPNGSNYQRLNSSGHGNNTTPHGHGHSEGTGPGIRGQGESLDVDGNVVPNNSPEAHWNAKGEQ